jgi:hypothetical protein
VRWGDYTYTGEDGLQRVETDFLVRVDGDLSRPRLEVGKHTEYRWLGPDDLAVLDENRQINDGMIRRIAGRRVRGPAHARALTAPLSSADDTFRKDPPMIGLVLAAGASRRLRPYTDLPAQSAPAGRCETTIMDISLRKPGRCRGLTDVTFVVGLPARTRSRSA